VSTDAVTTGVTEWARLATLDGWSALGQAAGGFATVAGVVFAIVSVNRWKRERRHERQSDVADALALAVGRACTALRTVIAEIPSDLRSGYQMVHRPLEPEAYIPRIITGDVLRAAFEQARQKALPALERLEEAYMRARLYLSDERLLLAVEVREIGYFKLGKEVNLAAIDLDAKKTLEDVEHRLAVPRTALFNRLFEIREQVVRDLGPLARLESSDDVVLTKAGT